MFHQSDLGVAEYDWISNVRFFQTKFVLDRLLYKNITESLPLLIRLQNCGIYYHRTSRKLIPYSSSNHFYQNGTDRNAIVTVVIYAILTMFKWCHIDISLFYIFLPLVMPYASNACTVILFYVICIDFMGFTLTVNCLFYWCDILTIDNCHVWFLRDWISLYSMCVF